MKPSFLRSSVFNILFFILHAAACVGYIPALLLPRKIFLAWVRFYLEAVMVLEYQILNLKWEIRGGENLPKPGPYIVAMKHQSTYETLKLHLLFEDPAVILKRELLWIPLYGLYLAKSDVIAIDRSTPEKASRSIKEGALRMKAQGRPIVIFPQGTRVNVEDTAEKRPYKYGVAKIQEITNLPIVPIALNSGVFSPRRSWLKKPGTVVFSILPPIPPGQDKQTVMTQLQAVLEQETISLAAVAREIREIVRPLVRSSVMGIFLALVAFAAWTFWWGLATTVIKNRYVDFHSPYVSVMPPVIAGYPGPMTVDVALEEIATDEGSVSIQDIHLEGYPLPLLPVQFRSGPLTMASDQWLSPLILDGAEGEFSYWNKSLTLHRALIRKDDFTADITGAIDFTDAAIPVMNLAVQIKNYGGFLAHLAQKGIIDQRTATFMTAGFAALSNAQGVATIPVTQKGDTLYAGPFAFAKIPMPAATSP
ncbi:MAG: 1-acyl-sn-glycerol-3-phosphate acyltransferase [Alphaproteobacteria bacterium]|nr:1-acyl-sn-glycerol-3-phosphate acyltransferase [Alphaproteobacteria bacterium]